MIVAILTKNVNSSDKKWHYKKKGSLKMERFFSLTFHKLTSLDKDQQFLSTTITLENEIAVQFINRHMSYPLSRSGSQK